MHAGQPAWGCKLCSNTNAAKAKVCKVCNARRQHADASLDASMAGQAAKAAMAHPARNPHAATNSAATQIELASMIAAQMSPGTADACEQALKTQHEIVAGFGTMQADRKELVNQLLPLEAALKALPDSEVFAKPRDALTIEIEAVKKSISNLAPLPERLVKARQCLTRCEARVAKANELVKVALAAQETAIAEVNTKKSEIAALEAAALAQHATAPAAGDCLQQLKAGMERVIADMTIGTVAQDVVVDARAHMENL